MRNFHLKALRAAAIALLPGESAEAKSRDERAAVLVRVASGQPSSVLLWATKIGGDTEESFLNKAKPVEWSSRQMHGGAHSKSKMGQSSGSPLCAWQERSPLLLWAELCLPKVHTLNSQPPVPQRVTLSGKRVIADGIS